MALHMECVYAYMCIYVWFGKNASKACPQILYIFLEFNSRLGNDTWSG